MTRRPIALVIVALVATGLAATGLAACGDDGPDADQARLELEGTAAVVAADGAETVLDDDATLDLGDTVTLTAGSADLVLADGSRFSLRMVDDAGSSVTVDRPLVLVAGDLLATDGFPAPIRVGDATVTALGATRVDADEARVEVYTGRATLAGVGDVEEVRALRQRILSTSATTVPADYDAEDDWDRAYLGEAIAFGRRLEALARGYTQELRGDGSRSFFEAVLPQLDREAEFGDDLLDPDRPAGETLVGAAIVVQGRDGTFRGRWEDVFGFRAQGAAWGLVALDQGVSQAPVLDTIEQAVAATPTAPTAPPPTAPPPTAPPTTTPPVGPPTTAPPTTPPPDPDGDGDGDPDDGLLEPVIDPVQDIVRELIDTLLG